MLKGRGGFIETQYWKKLLIILGFLGVMLILICFANISALNYIAGFNEAILKDVDTLWKESGQSASRTDG